MRLRPVTFLTLGLAALAPTGCDASPTAIESLDSTRLEQIMLATGSPVAPAQRVMLDVLARLEKPDGSPVELPHLDSLFRLAIRTEESRAPRNALALERAHRELVDRAWRAIDRGDTRAGEQTLAEARAFQAAAITEILGSAASAAFVSLLGRALDRANSRLVESELPGAAQRRLGRMSESARDLEADARAALARGNAAEALDIATHAAGLANALLRDLPPR